MPKVRLHPIYFNLASSLVKSTSGEKTDDVGRGELKLHVKEIESLLKPVWVKIVILVSRR